MYVKCKRWGVCRICFGLKREKERETGLSLGDFIFIFKINFFLQNRIIRKEWRKDIGLTLVLSATSYYHRLYTICVILAVILIVCLRILQDM